MAQRTGRSGGNALTREITLSVERSTSASPGEVYDVLADLRTHVEWGGERQAKKTRLLTIDAPAGAATVGTEFETTGADPMGRFSDRSVVTQADRPGLFEFVTEATLRTKRGDVAEWTNVHRYEVRADGDGSRIAYSLRIARISALPGMLRVMNLPVLSGIAVKASTKIASRGVENLSRVAERRAAAR
jgi:hypothetical protein